MPIRANAITIGLIHHSLVLSYISLTGAPQLGHSIVFDSTSFPHSEHFINAISFLFVLDSERFHHNEESGAIHFALSLTVGLGLP